MSCRKRLPLCDCCTEEAGHRLLLKRRCPYTAQVLQRAEMRVCGTCAGRITFQPSPGWEVVKEERL